MRFTSDIEIGSTARHAAKEGPMRGPTSVGIWRDKKVNRELRFGLVAVAKV
jgi:hypothetical protein